MRGWSGLEEYLHLVDRMLRGFLAAGGGSRRVVLFSDHGTSAVPSQRVDLEKEGAHWSARATSTLGFVASNKALRAEEVYPWFGLSREPEEPSPFVDRCPR